MPSDIGHRKLTAIVFTDVAGFSSKTQVDEVKTLRRVRDDIELLTSLSTKHNGKIIKTTGDGLLISFGSAIDAVSFALEAQRKIQAQNQKLPQGDRLQHRMGIHLGDIFLTESDAMGDGVNIAARLQSEAEPGGICVSQTVYDVVKNKLSINAVSIGPRELKNISEGIYAYRILVDAESGLSGRSALKKRRRSPKRRVVYYLVAGIIALILIFLSLRGRKTRSTPLPHTGDIQGTDMTRRGPFPHRPPQTQMNLVRQKLSNYSRENPLRLKPPARLDPRIRDRALPEPLVWMEGDMVIIKRGERVERRRLQQLNPRLLGAIIRELSTDSPPR